jgi:radical SAM superfamily enzyme YgiQ (UPF0313 family)
MRVLLVSTYELGHQPLGVASPAAALLAAGHEARCLDLAVEPWEPGLVDWAEAVAFSVPMHTAMRLAVAAARAVRRRRPELPICLYGLYAPVSRDLTAGRLADRVIAGEYEPALVAWVDGLVRGARPGVGATPAADSGRPSAGRRSGAGDYSLQLDRTRYRLPARHLLPPLERYAHVVLDGEERPVGYVEATRGCRHRCRHCPLPVVYDGALRAVDRETVLADIEQLVAMGARHVTFGDPDFLNAPTQSLRIVRALRERFPALTFDCTVKVEHVLEHARLWPELAASGCVFVVSAIETLNDVVLARLDKGHTAEEAATAIGLLRDHGVEPRPTFLAFTPWTSLEDIVELLDFVAAHDLVGNVDPVQYSLRLLLPEGSLLLEAPDPVLREALGPYDRERLTYTWRSPDPMVDLLQARLAELVERSAADGEAAEETFARVRAAAFEVAGVDPELAIPTGSTEGRPRLTEPWFC